MNPSVTWTIFWNLMDQWMDRKSRGLKPLPAHNQINEQADDDNKQCIGLTWCVNHRKQAKSHYKIYYNCYSYDQMSWSLSVLKSTSLCLQSNRVEIDMLFPKASVAKSYLFPSCVPAWGTDRDCRGWEKVHLLIERWERRIVFLILIPKGVVIPVCAKKKRERTKEQMYRIKL